MPAKKPPRNKAPPKPPTRASPPPNWPPLRPLIPTSDLTLTVLVPSQIILFRNLFTSTLCRSLISFASTLAFETTPGVPKKGDAMRINDRFLVEDPTFARALWEKTALKALISGIDADTGAAHDTETLTGASISVDDADEDATSMTAAEIRQLWGGEVLGLNPNVRLYRYRKGQFFRPHCKLSISQNRIRT